MTIIHAEERFLQKKKSPEPTPLEESKIAKSFSFTGPVDPASEKVSEFVPFKFIGDLAKTVLHQWVVVNPDSLPDPFPPEPQEPEPLVA